MHLRFVDTHPLMHLRFVDTRPCYASYFLEVPLGVPMFEEEE